MGLVLAFLAAVAYAVAYVLQYRVSAAAPDELALRPGLLVYLARRPVWLAGIAIMVVGNLLQGAALDTTSLGRVEPVLMASLLFALPLGAAVSRQRLHRHEWVAAVAVSAGVAVAIMAGAPTDVATRGSDAVWAVAIAVTWLAVTAATAATTRWPRSSEAAVLGAGAGVMFGLTDAITKSAFELGHAHGFAGLVGRWQPYVLVISACYGLVLAQSAYEKAPLPASLPALVIAEPIVGILLGVFLLGVGFRLDGPWLPLELLGGGVMVWGTWALARSPLVVARDREAHAREVAGGGKVVELAGRRRPDADQAARSSDRH